MKIGISFNPYGNTYARYGDKKFYKCRQHGYDAVDYNISVTSCELYTLNDVELKQKMENEKKAAQKAGIIISQVHGPWCCPPQDDTPELRDERFDKMRKSIVITSLLGCRYLVLHPIMPYGVNDLKTGFSDGTMELNIDYFTKLLVFAQVFDVTLCIENLPFKEFSLSKPAKVLEFVKTVNNGNLKICLDTGHVAVFPELSLSDEARELAGWIKVIHAHDNMGDNDTHMYPTKGIIKWHDFIKTLNELKYNGVFSLETSPAATLDDSSFEKESVELNRIVRNLLINR